MILMWGTNGEITIITLFRIFESKVSQFTRKCLCFSHEKMHLLFYAHLFSKLITIKTYIYFIR